MVISMGKTRIRIKSGRGWEKRAAEAIKELSGEVSAITHSGWYVRFDGSYTAVVVKPIVYGPTAKPDILIIGKAVAENDGR